ncbi:DUF6702 family protein [Idiomarina ramblicola]|uniref:Uncharacterized protein n=1 Tax=Idiomarina ramblicola TaxID=263724 RepID=A0A432YSZ0_9GAMM|nr:DUF6702 family protein [Idiomarina ramblicola]RUO64815.1 hypothetical protein CWI78_11620 [Idiomarina ramblicola]
MTKVVAALALLLALIPSVSAHRYFFGLTEISFNKNTHAMEIVHQYTLHDVQQALKKRLGKEFRLEQNDAEKQIRNWVNEKFQLTNSQGEAVTPSWVGFEADYQKIWIYQEVPKRDNLCQWKLANTLLMNSFSAQVNTINVVDDYGNRSLILTIENTSDTIKCQQAIKE